MKKFLSLVLALVMTMSLVTVSAGAKDFTDSDELSGEQYAEAVNVMSEMEIIDGYAGGAFQPQGTLTRGAAAKIIACMMLGKTTAEALGTQAAPFKDVPVGSTFAGYIAYCVESGLIDGYADGTFRPSNTLTGYAFLKMLLTALGYDSSIEGYTGANWTVNVMGRATQIGLTDGNDEFVGNRAATREEACLYAVNALKATLVEYADKGQEIVVSDGTVINVRPSAPTYITTSIAGAATSIDGTRDNASGDYTVEFAERYQPDLELDPDTDPFGRPSHTWSWKGAEIGTYVDYDKLVAEYTTEVTGKELYDLLGNVTIRDYKLTVEIDGVSDVRDNAAVFTAADMNKNNREVLGETGNGVLTQVFLDTNAKEITIAIINTYLAIADKDYDEKKDELDITAYGLSKDGDEYIKTLTATKEDSVGFTLDGEDFAIADYVEDDALLVTVAEGEVQTIADPELLSQVTITAFKKNSSVTVDGTRYDYSDAAEYKHGDLDDYTGENSAVNLKDTTYNVYLDQYGYAIGVEEVDPADNYLFITGIDLNGSNLGNRTAEANAIFLDGTMDTIEINMTRSTLDTDGGNVNDDAILNTWCTYTVSNNGVYTVEEVIEATNSTTVPGGANNSTKIAQHHQTFGSTYEISRKNISLDGGGSSNFSRVYGNDNSVYVTVELAEIKNDGGTNYGIIDDVGSVTTGVNSTSIEVWDTATAVSNANDAKVSGTAPTSGTTSNGVYTLYKDNGYIIATIVVGDDGGASKNLVYVTSSSVEQESYDSTTDEWTWTRMVAQNGEEVELKEVSDGISLLNGMKQDAWYQVKLNADGEVIDVMDADRADMNNPMLTILGYTGYSDTTFDKWSLTTALAGPPVVTGSYVNDINLVDASVDDEDTVLYVQGFQGDHPSMIGSTLFSTTTSSEGFFVAEDVNIVLRDWNRNKMDTTYETGVDNLEDIIEDLNADNGGNYNYIISAVLEDGAATTVVVYDATNTYNRPTDDVRAEDYDVTISGSNITDILHHINAPATEDDLLDVIVNELTEKGYKDISIDFVSGQYRFSCENSRGIGYTFYWTPANHHSAIKISVDGKEQLVNADSKSLAALGAKGVYSDLTFANGSKTLKATNSSHILWNTAANDGLKIESGYVQLTSVTATGAVSDWTVAVTGGAPTYIKDGDTLQITVSKTQAFGDSEFGDFTWSVNEACFDEEAVLTSVGDGTAANPAVITFYVTVDGATANTALTINAVYVG